MITVKHCIGILMLALFLSSCGTTRNTNTSIMGETGDRRTQKNIEKNRELGATEKQLEYVQAELKTIKKGEDGLKPLNEDELNSVQQALTDINDELEALEPQFTSASTKAEVENTQQTYESIKKQVKSIKETVNDLVHNERKSRTFYNKIETLDIRGKKPNQDTLENIRQNISLILFIILGTIIVATWAGFGLKHYSLISAIVISTTAAALAFLALTFPINGPVATIVLMIVVFPPLIGLIESKNEQKKNFILTTKDTIRRGFLIFNQSLDLPLNDREEVAKRQKQRIMEQLLQPKLNDAKLREALKALLEVSKCALANSTEAAPQPFTPPNGPTDDSRPVNTDDPEKAKIHHIKQAILWSEPIVIQSLESKKKPSSET